MPVNQMERPASASGRSAARRAARHGQAIRGLHRAPASDPARFAQTEEVLRAGLKDGLMPVRFLLEKIPAQCDGSSRRIRFSAHQEVSRQHSPTHDKQRLTQAITEAVVNEVLPAYQRVRGFHCRGVCAPRPHRARRHLAAGWQAALSE